MSLLNPGPHPEPPGDLPARQLPIVTLQGPWYRFHRTVREPLHFGATGNNRFDAPSGEYGIIYLGVDPHSAFIETFGHSTGINIVSERALAERRLSCIEAKRSLRLVDLTGNGLARIGADERLCAGDHATAQRWALALFNHPSQPDGLYYRARHDPSRLCIALFDRIKVAVTVTGHQNLLALDSVPLLANILDTYGFGLLD